MKVINVTASVSRRGGGLFYSVSSLVKAQQKAGLSVQAVGLYDADFDRDRSQWDFVPIKVFKTLGPKSYGFAPGLLSNLLEENADVIHSHGLWMYPATAASNWASKTKRPLIISAHGMLDPWALKNSWWKKMLASWVYENHNLKNASCLRALCNSEAASIIRLKMHRPIAVIPNGVDLPILVSKTEQTSQKIRTIISIGRIHKKKNLVPLIKAWRSLPKTLKTIGS